MTEEQWAWMDRYVRDVWDRMRLKDWHVEVVRTEHPPSDVWAQVWMSENKRRAHLLLTEEWAELTEEDRRISIVHEAIHCHLVEMFLAASEFRPGAAVEPETPAHLAAHRHAEEVAADQLAQIIAPLMPRCTLETEGSWDTPPADSSTEQPEEEHVSSLCMDTETVSGDEDEPPFPGDLSKPLRLIGSYHHRGQHATTWVRSCKIVWEKKVSNLTKVLFEVRGSTGETIGQYHHYVVPGDKSTRAVFCHGHRPDGIELHPNERVTLWATVVPYALQDIDWDCESTDHDNSSPMELIGTFVSDETRNLFDITIVWQDQDTTMPMRRKKFSWGVRSLTRRLSGAERWETVAGEANRLFTPYIPRLRLSIGPEESIVVPANTRLELWASVARREVRDVLWNTSLAQVGI